MERTIEEFRSNWQGWKARPPAVVAQVDADVTINLGERHGSWFIEFSWTVADLHRSAELAVTNATGLDDSLATDAYISVRASASSESHWTATSIYERRRSLSRVRPEDLEGWIEAAVRVASSYRVVALTDSYALPMA